MAKKQLCITTISTLNKYEKPNSNCSGSSRHTDRKYKTEVSACKNAEGIEKTEEKTPTATISAKRNYMHTIVITNIDHMGTPGQIGIDLDGLEEMKNDVQQDIPWQD